MAETEEIITYFIQMSFVDSLEMLGYAFILSVGLFLAIYILVWAIVQAWNLFRNITS